MLRTKFMILVCACASIIFSGVCCADTYSIPLTFKCSPSIEAAKWKELTGDPHKRYTLTTKGLAVAGRERDGLFTDRRSIETYILGGVEIVHVMAKCTSPTGDERLDGAPMSMFPNGVPADSVTLVCQKGQGLAIRFLSPNSPNPNQYIYHAEVTVDRDDPPVQSVDLLTQRVRVDLPQRGVVPPAMMGMGGGSSY